MSRMMTVVLAVLLILSGATVGLTQESRPAPGGAMGGMTHGASPGAGGPAGGGMGMMGPGMMGGGMMGDRMRGMRHLEHLMVHNPKAAARILRFRGDLLKAVSEVLLRHAAELDKGQ